MLKKILIGTLLIILLGAIIIGAYDTVRGASTLPIELQQLNPVNAAAQTPGGGQPGQGLGRGQGPGNEPGVLQTHNWTTLTGAVVSADEQQLIINTSEQGRLALWLGKPGFAADQGVTFNPEDKLVVLGFNGQNGAFQAAQITNETTGATLHLRDPNGRPLWAGQGQGQGGGQGRGQGQGQ